MRFGSRGDFGAGLHPAQAKPGQGRDPGFTLIRKHRKHITVPPGSPPPPLPSIAIIKPKKGAAFRCGEEIDCEVQITVPEGGDLPNNVFLYVMDGRGARWNGADATPAEKGPGGRYTLVGRPKAPDTHRRGPYQLYAEVVLLRVVVKEGGDEDGNFERFRTSVSIPIEVRR